MNLFGFLKKTPNQSTMQYEPQSYDPFATYSAFKDIYKNHPLGKRIVESIIKFSLSTPRKIIIQDAPQEVVEQYEKTLAKYKIEKVVKRVCAINRIYGMGGLFVATSKQDDDLKDLRISDLENTELFFNVLDPYNLNIYINQNPKSPLFLKPSRPRVGGSDVGGRRVYVAFNGEPLFIDYVESALNFAGRSVFQNMNELIILWDNLFNALDRIAIKASSILLTSGGAVNSQTAKDLEVAQASAILLKEMRQGGVASLLNGQTAEFFNLNGANEVGDMISQVKQAIAMALDDTPAAILLDKELSNGLSEGSEDMKAVVMAVNAFREDYLNPVYEFIDSYLFYKAWDDEFIKGFLKKGDNLAKYQGLSPFQIRAKWIEDFKFTWESVYPKTPDEETKEKDGFLDRMLKLTELGADADTIEANINSSGYFDDEITIKKEQFTRFEDDTPQDDEVFI